MRGRRASLKSFSSARLHAYALACALCWCVTSFGQDAAVATASAPARAKLYGAIPTPDQSDGISLLKTEGSTDDEVWEMQGKMGRSVRNVSNPTLTPVLPDSSKATGVAVIVAPGGAFYALSMDSEGFMVARWLADRGVAAFVLKYRLQPTPSDPKAAGKVMAARIAKAMHGNGIGSAPAEPVEDGAAAVRLVRERAAQWRVDPTKVGFIGFSAGASVALSVGVISDPKSRPDFIAPIYPPMDSREVPDHAPPMFLAIALDDGLFAAKKPLGLIDSWRNARRPLEVHLYERGGHGFGMNARFAAAAMWPEQFYAWLKDRKILPAQATVSRIAPAGEAPVQR